MHSLQGSQVTGNAIVGEVTAQDPVQIDDLFPNRQMTHPPH
jgi:hypothetical protein